MKWVFQQPARPRSRMRIAVRPQVSIKMRTGRSRRAPVFVEWY